MANNSTTAEILSFDMSLDGLNDIEFSNVDYSLMMSFLEDSQVQESDGEKLKIVIQSLESETGSDIVSFKTNSDDYLEDYQFSDVDRLDSCSTSPDHVGNQWTDMESMYASSFGDETNAYFEDSLFNNVENMTELALEMDYPYICYDQMPMEEDVFIHLWQ